MQILLIIGGTVVTILTTCIGERLLRLVNQKIRNENGRVLLRNIKSIILDTVKASKQAHVDEYKKNDKFHTEIQKEILDLTKNSIIKQLSKDSRDYIKTTYGDIDNYIVNQIETKIYDLKY